MPFIGKTPTRVPLTSADIQDSTINSAKITDDAIVNADVNSSAAIAYSKLNLTGNIALADLSATGTKDATTFLRGDNSFAEAGGGKVLQVVSTTKTDTFSITSTSFADITGLSVSITPSSASNKIMVFVDCYIGGQASASTQSMTRLMRDSTAICVGASAGSRTQASSESGLDSVNHVEPVAINFLDTPSTTSAITYKVQMRVTGGTHYVNRTSDDDDGDYNSEWLQQLQ
jgi:hypothetical protein